MRDERVRFGVHHRALLAVTLFAALAVGPAPRDASARQPGRLRHVLFLNSYQPGVAWADDLVRAMRSVLDAQPYPVELWVEFMDTRRFTGATYDTKVAELLAFKYRERTFDVVVAADDAALAFLAARHDALFAGVPVVFLGINGADLVPTLDRRTYTGVREVFRTGDFVEIVLSVRPETRRVLVVGDATPTAAAQMTDYRAVALRRPDVPFVFLDGSHMTLDEIVTALETGTTATDAVITSTFSRDYTNRYFPRGEALGRLVAASRGPVYSPTVSALGQGLLGGSENGAAEHATRAGRMVVDVLNGVPPEQIPIEIDQLLRFVVDRDQMARWKVDASRLPANAVVLNQPTSFYQIYRYPILIGAAFMLVQALVIGALVVNISRRRRAERELSAKAGQLAASNDDLARLNTSLRTEIHERQHAEEQLRQSHRIEAIGRLAGGIAHDFNNVLTVILSYSDILLETLAPDDPGRPYADQIRAASERAASLTQQLLAFSRKQVLQPTVVDLNAVVSGLEPMLRRLIGEDVRLGIRLAPHAVPVLVDKGQMEQVVVNLVANARDAMPDGGTLLVETHRLERETGSLEARAGMQRGQYAQLVVADTGEGMDTAKQARVFEPFFTTKTQGRGTGLGLSTVYGIVKQSGGWIWVKSEPGQGTTFTIDFPLSGKSVTAAATAAPVLRLPKPSASETILLVEDQDDVRCLTARVLESEGYNVLAASSGEDALSLAARHSGTIHLLLTDVVMPGLSGRQVAERLSPARGDTKVLFMSGYTDNVIAQRGVLDPGYAFISKPFTPQTLAHKVRQVLDLN